MIPGSASWKQARKWGPARRGPKFQIARSSAPGGFKFAPRFELERGRLKIELPEGTDDWGLCVPESHSRFCAPDLDGDGPITGAAVALEDLRQLCLWNVTARREQGASKGALYPQDFWEHASTFADNCLARSAVDEERSLGIVRCLGVSVDAVKLRMDLHFQE